MQAAILSTGTELTTGEVADGNSVWLAAQLTGLNVEVEYQLTVGDNKQKLIWAIRQLAEMVPLVVITGGLGPTPDDLTRFAIAEVANVQLIEKPELVKAIADFFERRRWQMKAINRVQACLPAGACGLENPIGTAPGISIQLATTTIFALPGVPREMRQMFVKHVRPWVCKKSPVQTHRIKLRCTGTGESDIVHAIEDIIRDAELHDHVTFGTLAQEGVISLKLTGPDKPALLRLESQLRDRLGDIVFGQGDQGLADVVGDLVRSRGQTLAVAESCTGGHVAKLITDVPGSSEYFVGGWVCYSNAFKQRFLAVPEDVLAKHGAVSAQCAEAMLNGLLELSGAGLGLAVTGIAGPGGATSDKPVGLVYIAAGRADDYQVKEFRFADIGRDAVRFRSAIAALNLLRLKLLRHNQPAGTGQMP